jgi:hypothetical protein
VNGNHLARAPDFRKLVVRKLTQRGDRASVKAGG